MAPIDVSQDSEAERWTEPALADEVAKLAGWQISHALRVVASGHPDRDAIFGDFRSLVLLFFGKHV